MKGVTEILPCLVCGHSMRADALQAGLDDVQSISREVERLDVAGQGEHNVLALLEHYQDEALEARAEVERARATADRVAVQARDAERARVVERLRTTPRARGVLLKLQDSHVIALLSNAIEAGEHDKYSVSEYSTRREAERHAARIRRALKGER